MDRSEIEKYSARYDEGYPEEHQAIERDLHNALTHQQYLTQDQLERVIRWKLDNQPGRRDRYIEDMRAVPDEFIRRVSYAALLLKDDPETQLKTLRSIPGIGGATAAVILSFYDPINYAVGDRYIVDALFGEDRGFRVTDYSDLLSELRERNPGRLRPPDCGKGVLPTVSGGERYYVTGIRVNLQRARGLAGGLDVGYTVSDLHRWAEFSLSSSEADTIAVLDRAIICNSWPSFILPRQ